MSNTANLDTAVPGRADQELEPLRVKWGWIVALGVVFLIAGIIALGSVVTATVASVAVVGVMMLVSGIAEIINAFSVKSWGKAFLWALLGTLYVVAGFMTFQNPLLAATVLTLMLGVALIISGFLRIFLGLQMTEGAPWAWVALSGVITLVLGGMILAQWPVSSLYVLGIFLGVDLVFAGIGWISIGVALKRRA
ncbi:HdeD family acid-resistance protein [Microvirga yunnanensis]|uniref:HdeD family acid-resistance protein n=1 Tax=Microvirga yunnanensis TaxID=2953740 RepID=UPI0021C89B94|nr:MULTISPECIES: HdeD family acid-resistance protein [unclassified Microvirga]